jgi:multidrug efflux pump subunit AcrB
VPISRPGSFQVTPGRRSASFHDEEPAAGVVQLELGDTKWQGELIQNFIIAVVSGILMVFAVLVLLYKRVLVPFVNMGSLLLAPLGAGFALWITGEPVSLPVFIGLLMLLGIVAKNSILLVDFAIEEMDRVCRQRTRPSW